MPAQATADMPTRTALHFAPASVGRARVSYNRYLHTYSVWAPGASIRSTKSYTRAMDIAVGLN